MTHTSSTLVGPVVVARRAIRSRLAVVGITDVGAGEMTTYAHWCIEKGYARWAGPGGGAEERARRAEGRHSR
ncbi:hypothetical protein ACFRQM_15260 [Streptomyces sp. NPDC056831]|uniref:hypothetical protein n=1 Tax=Streptomyces sp. NPDC056831 TaxID=3345954 RepID=UPI0036C0704F